MAGYQEWIELFDENISKIWQSERNELQKAAMLFKALERELQSRNPMLLTFTHQLMLTDLFFRGPNKS